MVNDSVRHLVEHVALRDALFSAGPRVILDFMDNPGPAMIELFKEPLASYKMRGMLSLT